LIADERAALEKEKESVIRTSRANKSRIEELVDSLDTLRKQVKPDSKREMDKDRERDDFGRIPKDVKMDEREDSVMREREEREKGVQIKGENGDVEVEY